jgi:hypothetical protein
MMFKSHFLNVKTNDLKSIQLVTAQNKIIKRTNDPYTLYMVILINEYEFKLLLRCAFDAPRIRFPKQERHTYKPWIDLDAQYWCISFHSIENYSKNPEYYRALYMKVIRLWISFEICLRDSGFGTSDSVGWFWLLCGNISLFVNRF